MKNNSNLDSFILDVDLKKNFSPVILDGMDRACPVIQNGSGGYFVLLDENPLNQERVKNYRTCTTEEIIEARARFLASDLNNF